MRKKIIILSIAVAIIPFIALAWNIGDPLVHCGTSKNPTLCSLCDLFVLGQNIVDFLTKAIAPALAVLAFAIAGFKILTSGGSPGTRQEGIKIIRNTIIGLLIIFSAWIIIDTLLVFFAGTFYKTTGGDTRPWNTITCVPPAPKVGAGVKGPAYDATTELTPKGDERRQLAVASINAKTNYCSDFDKPYNASDTCCTTLAQLPLSAISGLIALKNVSLAPIYITGGTETLCHSSHGPGQPIVDVRLDNTLDSWIFGQGGGTSSAAPGFPQGSRLYTSPTPPFVGVQFIYEFNKSGQPTHWHIIF